MKHLFWVFVGVMSVLLGISFLNAFRLERRARESYYTPITEEDYECE